jgi:hypothetical protein
MSFIYLLRLMGWLIGFVSIGFGIIALTLNSIDMLKTSYNWKEKLFVSMIYVILIFSFIGLAYTSPLKIAQSGDLIFTLKMEKDFK